MTAFKEIVVAAVIAGATLAPFPAGGGTNLEPGQSIPPQSFQSSCDALEGQRRIDCEDLKRRVREYNDERSKRYWEEHMKRSTQPRPAVNPTDELREEIEELRERVRRLERSTSP